MLRLVGSHYHFRRVVPALLRDIVGKRELWFSLRTADRLEAKARASYLYGQTSILFRKAPNMTPDEVAQLLNEQAEAYELILKSERKGHELERAELLLQRVQDHAESLGQFNRLKTATQELMDLMEKLNFQSSIKDRVNQERINDLKETISTLAQNRLPSPMAVVQEERAEPAPKPIRKAKLPISVVMAKHLDGKKVSPHTIQNAKKSMALFVSCFGDMDVRDINGNVVGDFRDALLSMPSVHGKSRKGLSIQEEIDRVLSEELDTLSPKTVKNHFSKISPAWGDLVRREVVPRNPWQGWDFDTTQKVIRRAWSDDELKLLMQSKWNRNAISQKTYLGIVMMGMYTGMRLGEIANLRNEDITEINGIPCFLLREHPETGWKPKTSAGIRTVPIHHDLMKFGIMNFIKENEKYLFSELKGSDSRSRGQTFANEFSKHKTSIGLPLAVTFHGFRHTVSTKLRNVKGDIREIWIDALLGHEASHKSMGTLNYTSGIDIENLHSVVECLKYENNMEITN